MLHVNVRPTMSLMKLPDDMKDGAVDISSRGTFTIGVSTDGNMYTWGYYTHTKDPKLNPLDLISASPARGKKRGQARAATVEELTQVDDIGAITAQSIVSACLVCCDFK